MCAHLFIFSGNICRRQQVPCRPQGIPAVPLQPLAERREIPRQFGDLSFGWNPAEKSQFKAKEGRRKKTCQKKNGSFILFCFFRRSRRRKAVVTEGRSSSAAPPAPLLLLLRRHRVPCDYVMTVMTLETYLWRRDGSVSRAAWR